MYIGNTVEIDLGVLPPRDNVRLTQTKLCSGNNYFYFIITYQNESRDWIQNIEVKKLLIEVKSPENPHAHVDFTWKVTTAHQNGKQGEPKQNRKHVLAKYAKYI